MAHIYLLLEGMMLCSITECSLGQNLSGIHRLENREIFMLLRQIKRIPSHSCLKDRTDFKFPGKRGNVTETQTSQGTCYHHLMLQQIINLFNTEDSHAACNNTLLHQLLSHLDHGLEQLEQMEDDHLACPYLGSVVRKYFQRIHRYLKEKEYSS
uniref:Interferon delta 7 n=1 Tax=Sus scrofa TaxID=9823 RepID=A0A8D1VCH2_PIG